VENNNTKNENNVTSENSQRSFSQSKTKLLLLIVPFFLLISFAIFSFIYLSKSSLITTTPKEASTTSVKTILKTEKNSVAIYTRCFDGKTQPSVCNMYSSNLEQPEEKLVYSFKFPKVKQTAYERGFQLKLIGQIDNKIVYQTNYWTNPQEGDISIFGFIDLTNAKNTEVYKFAGKTPKEYLLGSYLDQEGKKIYYSTEEGPDQNNKIYQYDLVKMQNKNLINDTILKKMSLQVISTNKNKIFLSLISRVGDHKYWDYSYDLSDNKLIKKEITIDDPVFDKTGKKYAYVMKEQTSNKTFYNLRLKIGDTETLVEKEIISISSVRIIPGDGGCDPTFSCTGISAKEFNNSGSQLLYSISNFSKGDQKFENQSYIYTEFPNNEDNKIKDTYKILPQILQPTWVSLYRSSPSGKELTNGLLYKYNEAWFIKPIYEYDESDIDLLSHESVQDLISVVANANNLIIVP